jgi:glycosyltransferase involved in cell wall biosynthesis
MRILHLSQYYAPEAGAVQVRADVIDRHLAGQGHKVTVLTEVPNHPGGTIWPEYRGRLYTLSRENEVDVLRMWVKTSPAKSFRTRMAFYLSYMIGAVLAGVLMPSRCDVVFANSPPLFVAAAGAILGLLKRKPFVMEVHDLWPQSAVEMGELRGRRSIALATRLESFCYQQSLRVIAVSRGIWRNLQGRLPTEKLALCSNGSNIDVFRPRPEKGERLRQELGLGARFLAVYGGILGVAQGLETVLHAAKLLEDRADIHFLIVGEGPKKEDLVRLHTTLGLTNLDMIQGQPLSRMPGYFSAADVCLVPLRRLDVFKGVLPTKMFDAWACQTPTVISVDGEAREVMEEVGAGVFVEPENPEALAGALLRLREQPDSLKQMGLAGRQAVLEQYSLQATARQIEAVLREATAE